MAIYRVLGGKSCLLTDCILSISADVGNGRLRQMFETMGAGDLAEDDGEGRLGEQR
jgi:hypothetical protein